MNMKFSIIIGLFFLSTAMLIAQPKIKIIPGNSFDLGDLYKGQKGERVVMVKNVGTDTLRINQVKAQCGCTATLLKERALGPSDSTQLSISFDTQNQGGKVTKQVYVSSNDTTEPKLTIQFTANVIEVLKFSPGNILFDRAILDSTYTKIITISNPSKEMGIKILSLETKFDNLKITLMKNALLPGEETQLQAVYHATKTGAPQGTIQLTTDHPLQKVFNINVIAWVNRK
jgi:hypothetical protein